MKVTRNEVFDALKEKIVECKEWDSEQAEQIKEESYLDYNGIGLDSLQLLTILVCMEEDYNFELSDMDLSLVQLTTVKDIVDLLSQKTGDGT